MLGTFLGLTEHDGRLVRWQRRQRDGRGRGGASVRGGARGHRRQRTCRPYYAFERELAVYATRRQIFDDEVHRVWERRVSAADEIGDGIFLVFSRSNRPIDERLSAIASRLEAAPQHIERAEVAPRHAARRSDCGMSWSWNRLATLPSLFDEVVAAARSQLADGHAEITRLERASSRGVAGAGGVRRLAQGAAGGRNGRVRAGQRRVRRAGAVCARSTTWTPTTSWPSARSSWRAIARAVPASRPRSTRRRSVEEVVDRVKSDHPADFAAALAGYRRAMAEARQFVIDHDIASLPDGETLEVIETPEYMRARPAVRRLLPATEVRARAAGAAFTSSRRRSTATRAHCASTTTPRSTTRASTRRTPATTSSSWCRSSTRASCGRSSMRPSSSRAGRCTASR